MSEEAPVSPSAVDKTMVTAVLPATTTLASTPATAKSDRYLPALAFMRFIAVGGVIWTHACGNIHWMGSGFDFADAGRFGSAFFTQCSVFLVMLKAFGRTDLTWSENARGRFLRVYVPFLLWSLIYAANIELRAIFLHEGERYAWDWDFFWNGSTYHLWFLPFIFIIGLLLFGFARWIARNPKFAMPMAIALVIAGSLANGLYFPIQPDSFGRDYMFRLAWNRLPSVCWASAFAIFFQFGGREVLRTQATLLMGIAIFFASVVTLGMRPYWHVFENLAGAGGMLAGLSILNAARIGWGSSLGKLTYGMYLCHLLFLGFLRTLWHKTMGASDTYIFAIFGTLLTIPLSAFASLVLAKTKGLKVLVPA